MSTVESLQKTFTAAYLQQNAKQDRWNRHRTKAWDHFLSLGLPHPKSEPYRYVPLRKFYQEAWHLSPSPDKEVEIASHVLPECTQSVLVFINGSFSPAHSLTKNLHKGVIISPLSKAMQTYGALLHNQWTRSFQTEKDPFVALNGALHHEGVFLYLPPKRMLEVPIQILHIVTENQKEAFLSPRFHLFMGRHATLSLCQTLVCNASPVFMNSVASLSLDEGARLTYTSYEEGQTTPLRQMQGLRAHLKAHAHFEATHLTTGGGCLRYDDAVYLEGENAEASLRGTAFLSGQCEAHTHVHMEHAAPHCRSNQLFKNVLTGTTRSSFEGKIFVHKEAQKTEAYQRNNNLLLTSRAQAYSKPNLEILADDVKASHGATVGGLDLESLVYMRTKGIPLERARELLVRGFTTEVVESIDIPSLREKLDYHH